MNARIIITTSALACLAHSASAQSVITRYVISSGGGRSVAATHILTGTIGQSLAGTFNATTHTLRTGFWIGQPPAACYANCDNSVVPPVLTANDFQCFLNRYASAESYANCDGIGGLTANDFQCFLNAFAAGCS